MWIKRFNMEHLWVLLDVTAYSLAVLFQSCDVFRMMSCHSQKKTASSSNTSHPPLITPPKSNTKIVLKISPSNSIKANSKHKHRKETLSEHVMEYWRTRLKQCRGTRGREGIGTKHILNISSAKSTPLETLWMLLASCLLVRLCCFIIIGSPYQKMSLRE